MDGGAPELASLRMHAKLDTVLAGIHALPLMFPRKPGLTCCPRSLCFFFFLTWLPCAGYIASRPAICLVCSNLDTAPRLWQNVRKSLAAPLYDFLQPTGCYSYWHSREARPSFREFLCD